MGPDPLFYHQNPALSVLDILAELALPTTAVLRADPEGASLGLTRLSGVASIDNADPSDIAFLDSAKALRSLEQSGAGLVLVPSPLLTPEAGLRDNKSAFGLDCQAILIGVSHPRAAFAQVARRLFTEKLAVDDWIDPSAAIGEGTIIEKGVVIGPGVRIGRNGLVRAGASIRCALIGDGVTIASGARIGDPGYGVAPGPRGLVDMPQLGRVILQDQVSIGANTCVDRGALGDTVIGEGTKIDNLCQIAHNVRIGRHCIVAANCGISGSTILEDGVMLGGSVGIADHLHIGAGAKLAAGSSHFKNVPAGETWSGYPARPLGRWQREIVWLGQAAGRRK